jgi:hypothetical protein
VKVKLKIISSIRYKFVKYMETLKCNYGLDSHLNQFILLKTLSYGLGNILNLKVYMSLHD